MVELTGTVAPDFIVDVVGEVIGLNVIAPQGPQGDQGPPGAAGKTVLYGTAVDRQLLPSVLMATSTSTARRG
jgi:hypothetical protein